MDPIRQHCDVINRCNQRSGRMLSLVDLIEAGTITRPVAAYLVAAIGKGAPFLVAAQPPNAGKTTVMGALLNLVPPAVTLEMADSLAPILRGKREPTPRRCYVCPEIGQGAHYGYLWADELRTYFDLPYAGHMIASTLHADSVAAVYQTIKINKIIQENLWRTTIILILTVRRERTASVRRLSQLWESNGTSPHIPLVKADSPTASLEASQLVSPAELAAASDKLEKLLARKVRYIEEVRRAILELAPAAPTPPAPPPQP